MPEQAAVEPESAPQTQPAAPVEDQRDRSLDGNAVARVESRAFINRFDQGWRRIQRWFSVTMGTGICAVLLATIPFKARWLHYLSIVFFVLNVVLWTLAAIVSFVRYTLYPEIWSVMIHDPKNSLFLGTSAMGFFTIVEMIVIVCVPAWGSWCAILAWVLWMIDSVASAAVTVSLCFILISSEDPTELSEITAAQLLPVSTTVVAAAVGARVAEVLPNPQHALGTLITSYVMWGMATPLAMAILVIYYQRLAVHKLPSPEVLVSCFLPLGPLGFGGFGILYMGNVARHLFPITNTIPPNSQLAGDILHIVGFLAALIMWGFGLVWLAFAVAAISRHWPLPFNMGWWGFTFPLGVYASSTVEIGNQLPSEVFKVLGTIFTASVVLLWIVVAVGTARGAWNGTLFHAPCLARLSSEHVEKGRVQVANSKNA